MAVTSGNIIIGPVKSFTVDTTDVGATSGGVSVQPRDSFRNITVDQVVGTIKKGMTDRQIHVVTTLSETTLDNLKIAFDLGGTISTDGTSGSKTLGIGMDFTAAEHTLTFVGPGPDGFTRTFTINRAVGYATGNYQLRKDNESVVQVNFHCLPDMTKPAGQEYGTIVDTVVTP